MATKPKPKPVPGRVYSTFKKPPPKTGYTQGDVVKLGKNQQAYFTEGLGYYAGPKQQAAKKPTVKVVKKGTPQNSFTTIETPAQIEERVKRMAAESFTTNQKVLNDQADRLRREAEGRRLALQDAYGVAAKLNAGFGLDVQSGWEQAAKTITGLAGTATGGVQDALRADLATQEQALSRVGAGGTGFDATSQGQTEYFRGGGIPGEYDTRMGGIGRQWMNEAAQALSARGLQEGIAAENVDRGKINADLAAQIGDLTTNRTKEESTLREQLLGARSDQIKAVADEREFQATLAIKKVQIEQAQQKINNQFQVALANAGTSAQRAEVYRWKAEQDQILSAARVGIAQQNADSSRISANASATRAANANSPKAATPASKRVAISSANKAGQAALDTEIGRITSKLPGMGTPEGQTRKEYVQTPEYAKALAAAKKVVSQQYFGSLMYRVINAVGPYLKEIGYTPTQIKRAAYNIASAKVDPSRSWLQSNPGFGPKV